MRIIKVVNDRESANSVRYLLVQAGIPSYLSLENDQAYRVWVYFDSQFDSARCILADIPEGGYCPVDVNDYLSDRSVAQAV